jgi:hypothetical protein
MVRARAALPPPSPPPSPPPKRLSAAAGGLHSVDELFGSFSSRSQLDSQRSDSSRLSASREALCGPVDGDHACESPRLASPPPALRPPVQPNGSPPSPNGGGNSPPWTPPLHTRDAKGRCLRCRCKVCRCAVPQARRERETPPPSIEPAQSALVSAGFDNRRAGQLERHWFLQWIKAKHDRCATWMVRKAAPLPSRNKNKFLGRFSDASKYIRRAIKVEAWLIVVGRPRHSTTTAATFAHLHRREHAS